MNKLITSPAQCKDMNAIIYVRVSDPSQIQNYSLDTQEENCRSYCKNKGYIVKAVFREEGESAKTADRTELLKLLNYCHDNRKNIHSVIVWKFDRFARNTSDHLAVKAKLAEYGIKLESSTEPTDDSPAGRFMETLFSAVAQLDNEVRADRTRNGLYKQFKSGITTKVPNGYKVGDVNGKRAQVEDEETLGKTKEMWHLMNTGTKSLSEMVKEAKRIGYQVKFRNKYKPVTKQYLSKMFRNKFYIGILTSDKYPGEEVKAIHTPLITEQEFYNVQRILDGRNPQPLNLKRLVNNPLFPLRGLVKCEHCNTKLTSGNVKGRSTHYPKYWCLNKCIGSISSEALDDLLKDKLSEIQPTEDLINGFAFVLRVKYGNRINKYLDVKKQADKKILEQKEFLVNLCEGHAKGLYPDDIFKEMKQKIENKLLSLQITSNENLIDKYDVEKTSNFIKALFKDLPKAYEVSDFGQRRILLGSIYPSGLHYDGKALLNHDLGAGFVAINALKESKYSPDVLLSALKLTQIEPILSNFQPLILAYPNYESQFNYA